PVCPSPPRADSLSAPPLPYLARPSWNAAPRWTAARRPPSPSRRSLILF
uniref:Uncharacterized protein n=1 Tax=Aegilops tauschii subsp. strangulata TaxID=200361 RepID=A0A453MJD9_AEGTS